MQYKYESLNTLAAIFSTIADTLSNHVILSTFTSLSIHYAKDYFYCVFCSSFSAPHQAKSGQVRP